MTRRQLFLEAARLPEELSRLLFLEPVLAGRRVLEVGARSDAVARFLIELGATRVVCASDDKDLIETLRAENDLERVDFRVVRPGVLPGDDGAFDLVIDFTLPEALAAGQTFRLTDVARLLSEDGFCVTSLRNPGTRGLATLLGASPRDAAPVVDARSAAGLAAGGNGPVSYRGLVEALKLQFELVQVYFQSLLLGYLFGSFDVEPKDDGVAPNTALMGTDPEPAGHYLFAFGNAIPVIEDVALVQVPFSDLLEVIAGKGPGQVRDTISNAIEPVTHADDAHEVPTRERSLVDATGAETATVDAAEGPAIDAAPVAAELPAPVASDVAPAPAVARDEHAAEREVELLALRAQVDEREDALVQIAGRIERLKSDVDGLVVALERRTSERDDLQAFVEGLETAVVARDAQIQSLRADIEATAARASDLESAAQSGGVAADEAVRLAAALEAAQAERRELVEQLVRLEGEKVTLENRVRVLEEAHELSIMRVGELEEQLLSLEGIRGQLAADVARVQNERIEERERLLGERHAERHVLEAALTTHQAQVQALESALDQARQLLGAQERALEGAITAARAEIELRVRALEGALEETRKDAARARRDAHDKQFLEERAHALEARLEEAAAVVGELEERRQQVDDLGQRIEQLEERLRKTEQNATDRANEVVALTQTKAALEADAQRLVDGVKTLVGEREEHRARAEAAEARVGALVLESDAVRARLADTERQLAEATEQAEGKEKRLRAAHAGLEEARKDLGLAREGLQEVAGQRDTLKQVVGARERELAGVKDELLQTQGEIQRLREQVDTHQKAVAEARQRLSAAEVERAQHKRNEEQLARDKSELATALEAAEQASSAVRAELASATAALSSAQAEAVALRAKVDATEGDALKIAQDLEEQLGRRNAVVERLERELAAAHDRHTAELAKVLAARDALADEMRTLEEDAGKSLAAAEDERKKLRRDISGCDAEIARLRAALVEANAEIGARGDAEAALRTEVDALRARVASAEAALRTDADAHQEAFADELKRAEATEQRLRKEIDELRARGEMEGEAQAALLDDAAAQVARAEEELTAARIAHDEDKVVFASEQARAALFAAALDEAQGSLLRQSARAELLRASLGEARSLLDVERARGDLFHEELEEAHVTLGHERARGDLFASTLHEAHTSLARERARGDLLKADLEEAQDHIFTLRGRARALVADARTSARETSTRADLAHEVLREAQARLDAEKSRGDLLQAQLEEARATHQQRTEASDAVIAAERVRAAAAVGDLESAAARARTLAAQLADESAAAAAARATADQRVEDVSAAAERAIEEERANASLAHAEQQAASDVLLSEARTALDQALADHESNLRGAGKAIAGLEAELKDLKEKLGERGSDEMLAQAELERLQAMVESAERERDALLGDLGSHQARANAEAARRVGVEDELTKLRVANNQVVAEVQRLKQDAEAGKRSPEVEAELTALKERLEAVEKAGAEKDAKIVEQADRINRLTQRLVREAGIA